jgi:Nucleoporin autopeptidase
MEELAELSNEELSCVEGFIIENRHVKVVFRGPVDLRCADLDAVFKLAEKSIEIDCEMNRSNPQAFQQPAELTFFNWSVPRKYENNKEAFLAKLEEWVSKFGGTFVDYDEDRENLYAFVDCV